MSSFKDRTLQFFRRLMILASLLAVAYIFTILYKQIIKSDRFFVVQHFEISGTTYLTHRDIVALSKVKLGDQILDADLDEIARLIARSPYVKDIVVEVRLPSTIYVVIEERKPIAYINSNPIRIVSEDAVTLPRAIDYDYPDLPILIYDGLKKVNDGDRIKSQKIEDALSTLIKMKTVSKELFHLIAEINLNGTQARYSTIMGGALIRIPDEKQTEQFLAFHYFLEKMKNTNFLSSALYIDLRFKDRVIIKDRKG